MGKSNARALICAMTSDPHDELLRLVASNVRELRERRGVTREQLGEAASVDPQMIKRIENGRSNPALIVLSRLACALTISLSLMLSGDVAAATVGSQDVVEAESVGETIKALRKERKLSRRGLANQIGVRTITLSRYEDATADTRILSLEPLSRALGMSVGDLVRAIELRQQQSDRARGGWHARAEGVQCRLVSSTPRAQLWEWRIAPRTVFEDVVDVAVAEEIATAIRGEISVAFAGETHRLRRGGSVALAGGLSARRFENRGASTARLLRFQVAI